jgi:hypothetical protein
MANQKLLKLMFDKLPCLIELHRRCHYFRLKTRKFHDPCLLELQISSGNRVGVICDLYFRVYIFSLFLKVCESPRKLNYYLSISVICFTWPSRYLRFVHVN